MDERLERHLYNLHNEVFEAAESRINTDSSLIICEGISSYQSLLVSCSLFPHYMWGYIAEPHRVWDISAVPSLYVRVYRLVCWTPRRQCGSLIICEGISIQKLNIHQRGKFPHYMWGYIGWPLAVIYRRPVPSLYVRVYRVLEKSVLYITCSLIICEGISSFSILNMWMREFPHYMWGYIEIL